MVVQGFGNVGAIAARLFHEQGARILAVSDSQGGIYNEKGLEVGAVQEHKKATNSVVDMPGARTVSNEELLTLPCDILIPAALENQIRSDNAGAVQARFIVEGANGPTTPAADRILFARGIPVLPDILASAGGVTVSYFEWVQNNENEQWDLEKVNQKLQVKVERATDAVIDKQQEINGSLQTLQARRRERGLPEQPLEPVDLRTAAWILAMERVSQVTLERGGPSRSLV